MKTLSIPVLLSLVLGGCVYRISDEPDTPVDEPRQTDTRPDPPAHDPGPAVPSPSPAPTTPDPAPTPNPGATPGTCLDDSAEDDDVFEDGVEVIPTLDGAVFVDGILDDEDWMWINALPGEELEIEVVHDTPGADFDFYVWDALGVVDETYVSVAGVSATVFVPASDDGQYVDILLAPYAGECVPYTVAIYSTSTFVDPGPPPPPPPPPPASCVQDGFEYNNTLATAPFVSAPLYDLVLDDSDIDLFAVEVYPGEEIFVWTGADVTYGDVDLRLLDAWGDVLALSETTGDEELLSYVHSYDTIETLYIETVLWGASIDTCQVYDLDFWIEALPVCYEDDFEYNDTWEEAVELVPDTGWSVSYELVSGLDDDWFYFVTFPYENVDVVLEHSTYGGDIDLTVSDSYGELGFDIADAPGVEAWVNVPGTDYGDIIDVLVQHYSSPDSCVPYTLTLDSY